MAIETGAGLAFLGVCVTAAAGIAKFVPSKNSGNNLFVSEKTCQARHEAFASRIEAIYDEQVRMRQVVENMALRLAAMAAKKD